MSVPKEKTEKLAATAAAEPPEDPPGTLLKSIGFFVGPNAECSPEEPMANSSIFALPKITAPCCFNFSTTVASYDAI